VATENLVKAFENGRISNFQGLVTLTLTLCQVTLHTVVHHSSPSTYKPNFTEIEKNFLWTDGRTPTYVAYVRTYVWTYVCTYGRMDGRTDI